MDAEGKVIAVRNGVAELEVRRKESCGDHCANCSGCAAAVIRVFVNITDPVSVGDWVLIESEPRFVFLGLLVVFILPLILPVAAYFATRRFGFGGVSAAVATGLSFVLIWRLGRSKWYLTHSRPRMIRVISKER